MSDGWIKLHRKLTSWEWYTDSKMVHLFLHILLNANHDDNKWRGIEVLRGQLITGINSLSESTGISTQSIRTCLNRLKSTSEITIKSTNKYSVITVCNYDSYQIEEKKSTSKSTRKPTNNQQSTNNKQEGEEDNDKSLSTWRSDFDVYLKECREAYIAFEADKKMMDIQQDLNPSLNVSKSIRKGFTNYWSTKDGWEQKKKSKSNTINWRRTIINSIEFNKVYLTKEELSERNR